MDARLARQEAKRLLGAIAAGRNLVAIRDREKSTPTFAATADRFLEEHGKKVERRTIGEYERLLRQLAIPAFGRRPVDTIDRAIIAKLHYSLSGTPRQANLLLSVLSKLMGWAATRGLLLSEVNPCKGIERYKENKRERFLTTTEIAGLGEALREVERDHTISIHAAAAVRLLLLTGARLSEILTLRLNQVDFDRGVLRLPRSKTGAKTIYLTKAAAEILNALPRVKITPTLLSGSNPALTSSICKSREVESAPCGPRRCASSRPPPFLRKCRRNKRFLSDLRW